MLGLRGASVTGTGAFICINDKVRNGPTPLV